MTGASGRRDLRAELAAAQRDAEVAFLAAQRDALEQALVDTPRALLDDDPDEMTRGILQVARALARAAFALYIEEQSDVPAVTTPADPLVFAEPPQVGRASLLVAGLHSQAPLRLDDVTRYTPTDASLRPYGQLADGRVVRSWLVLPVASGRDRHGAILLGHPQPRAFTERDERLGAALAQHMAVALAQAEMLRERTRIASALQQTLLPPLLPTIPGVDVAARYRAAGEENLVGGDFYDMFELDDDGWALVLGDVSGIGPEAAAITGLARYTVRAVARELASPSAVLRSLNDAIVNQRSVERFCTAVYLRVTPVGDGARIVLSRGGHPPPLVLRDDGSVEVVGEVPGTLLGLFPEVTLSDVGIELQGGDTLVLYTDGVIEARDGKGEQFGVERLAEVLESSAGRTADGVARRIELAVRDFHGGVVSDDVAIVVVRAVPPRMAD